MNNNTKTSYSLSKLKLNKKTSQNLGRQKALKLPLIRQKTRSQLSRKSEQHNKSDLSRNQKDKSRQVYEEYYATNVARKSLNVHLETHTYDQTNNFADQIQQQMKKVIQDSDYEEQNTLQNVIIQDSDVDMEFAEKIMENKQLLKIHRQKMMNSQSQQNLKPNKQTINQSRANKGSTKKMSLIENRDKQLIKRMKSKSLFPQVKNLSLKTVKPLQRRQIKSFKEAPIRQKTQQEQTVVAAQMQTEPRKKTMSKQISKNNIRLTEFVNEKKNRKLMQLKLQDKLSGLKNKISQRTSSKQVKSRQSFIQGTPLSNKNQELKSPRNGSHSVFDGIQDFLSNPHETGSKSQRKFIRSSQRELSQTEQVNLRNRILKLQQKINNFQDQNQNIVERAQSGGNQSDEQTVKQNAGHIDPMSEEGYLSADCLEANRNNEAHIKSEQREHQSQQKQQSYSQDRGQHASVQVQIRQDNEQQQKRRQKQHQSNLFWRHIDKENNKNIITSDFQKELKYIVSLEQKNEMILNTYVENQKTLFELNLLNRNKEGKGVFKGSKPRNQRIGQSSQQQSSRQKQRDNYTSKS